MIFLPSLLEYNPTELTHKLKLITQNTKDFLRLQQSEEIINLHLDFVLPKFAKSRGVKSSNDIQTVFELLSKHFDQQHLNLSIHLMATWEDMEDNEGLISFLANWGFDQPDFEGTIFVDGEQLEFVDYLPEISNFKCGTWLDLGQWQEYSFEAKQNYLLMTVVAGQSGQKLDSSVADKALQIATNNRESNFIFDGGWSVLNQTETNLNNVDIVSYSSFWTQFQVEVEKNSKRI